MSGHALMNEGAAFDDAGNRKDFGRFVLNTSGEGRAKCSCGELSEVFLTASARKLWHRDHKAEMKL